MEFFAKLRHPNLRPLLGITLAPEGMVARLTLSKAMERVLQ